MEWLYKFIHNKVPRYCIYSFEKMPSNFSVEREYIEGVANYSLLFILFMLICLLLIWLSVFVLHINVVDYSAANVYMYKTMTFIFGFLAFFGAMMAFVGITIIIISLRKVTKDQLRPALNTVEEFHGYLNNVSDDAFGLINGTLNHLKTAPEPDNWLKKVAQKAQVAVAVPILEGFMTKKPQMDEIKTTIIEILEMLKSTVKSGKSKLLSGILFIIFTIIIAVWMTLSSLTRKGTDCCLCRISTLVMMVWWLIGAATIPILIVIGDTCHHPMAVVAAICTYLHPDINPQLIYYYGDCTEPNPLQEKLDTLYSIISYIMGPLGTVIAALGFLDPTGNTVTTLRKAQHYMESLNAYGGCSWSGPQAKLAFADICTNMIMGVGFVTLGAIFIGLFLTFAVMSCIRLREFKGWPKRDERIFPCPSTCLIHREMKEPLQPCRPKPIRSEIIWPPPKEYDRRITCPITCRGHDKLRAQTLNLRTTCAKKCRGMIPGPPPPRPPRPKRKRREYIKKSEDKAAVCCIEVYERNKCVQEAAKDPDIDAKCDSEKCESKMKSKQFLTNCGLYRCKLNKNKRKLEKAKEKSKEAEPIKEPKPPPPPKKPKKKQPLVKCGIEKCKKTFQSVENIKHCGLSICKKKGKAKKIED